MPSQLPTIQVTPWNLRDFNLKAQLAPALLPRSVPRHKVHPGPYLARNPSQAKPRLFKGLSSK